MRNMPNRLYCLRFTLLGTNVVDCYESFKMPAEHYKEKRVRRNSRHPDLPATAIN